LLLDMGQLANPAQVIHEPRLRDPTDAERLAVQVRARLGEPASPMLDLGRWAERLGLYSVVEDRGEGFPLGVYRGLGDAGIAWVNGSSASGRRRFTLAHELGHHLVQDEYSLDWRDVPDAETERLLNAFAIHLLLPRQGVTERWARLGDLDERSRAIVLASEFGVSWSAACAQFERLGLLEAREAERMRDETPRKGEFLELGVRIPGDLEPPYVSPLMSGAILAAYRRYKITAVRAVELLYGSLTEEELPPRPEIPLDAYIGDLDPLE